MFKKLFLALIVLIIANCTVSYAGDSILPPVGEERCFTRSYDRTHLASHPDQTVTSMLLKLWHYSEEARISHAFRIGVTRRGDQQRYVTGDVCRDNGAGRAECAIACDLGLFELERSKKSGSINLILKHIAFSDTCGDDIVYILEPGVDDKIFRLDPVSISQCGELD
jgi:hypothetical protein